MPLVPVLSDKQQFFNKMDEYLKTMGMIPIETLKLHYISQHINYASIFLPIWN